MALVVSGNHHRPRIATILVADWDDSADFARNFYYVSLDFAYDVKPAPNIYIASSSPRLCLAHWSSYPQSCAHMPGGYGGRLRRVRLGTW